VSIYLNSYRPLSKSKVGLDRAISHKIPPFVDGSCRREPDLESKFPSITALCRKGKFAPKLKQGDVVVYITVMGTYLDVRPRHWRLTAILKVLKAFPSHGEGARWYATHGYQVPSNCMVPGNPPMPMSKTAYQKTGCHTIEKANDTYRKRASDHGIFLVCKELYRNLRNPPVIHRKTMLTVFGKIPGTQNPPRIQPQKLRALVETLRVADKVKKIDRICPV
jgi:hypothetical protein